MMRAAVEGVQKMLDLVPERDVEGTKQTPERVVKAFMEMTSGYYEDPAEILSKRFRASYDEMVCVRGIEFTSLCEHHLLPFRGEAAVAYIPRDEVVGLSKMGRLVLCFARRLQLQERMTTEIATALQENLKGRGVGVLVRAHHQCMGCRGVKLANAEMVTSALLGIFRQPEVRAEFMALTKR